MENRDENPEIIMMQPTGKPDRGELPPFDPAAESALLGCVLLANNLKGSAQQDDVWALISQRIGTRQEAFYDIRHQVVYQAMLGLRLGGRVVDIVTLAGRLKDNGRLDDVGGMAYLDTLQDKCTGPSMASYYLEIVWEKFLARRAIQTGLMWAERARVRGSLSEAQFEELSQDVEVLKQEASAHLSVQPKNLARPMDFERAYFDWWFKHEKELAGLELPWPFPLRIRRGEMTLFTGENGAGKSSMLGQIAVHLASQGAKICIASMEQHPAVTLWIMARQLLAKGKLLENEAGAALAKQALAWLESRMLLYNFLGITTWQDLLNTWRWAAERDGCTIFICDSVMRIGIPDDDYATQGLCAAQFAHFAMRYNAHVFLVHHQNKSDGTRLKDKVRGSRQWTDNAHNVCGVMRNEKKAEELQEVEEALRTATPADRASAQREHDETVEQMRKVWDSKFVLNKQRYPGSQQNGSKFLWFHPGPLLFLDNWRDKPKATITEHDEKL